jgi:hypothetical protein
LRDNFITPNLSNFVEVYSQKLGLCTNRLLNKAPIISKKSGFVHTFIGFF